MAKITVQDTEISIIHINGDNYISITDLARHKSDAPNAVIGNWMRNRNTIEYLGIWEQLFNPRFKPLEFEGFKKEAGLKHAPHRGLSNTKYSSRSMDLVGIKNNTYL